MKTKTHKRTIYITERDMKRLLPLLEKFKNSREDLNSLKAELDQAVVVPPTEIPADVITMNSKARLREVKTGEEMTFTIVYPVNASIDDGKISVLAPVGTAMLGHKVGDEFSWEVPAGPVRLRVEEILYQPEAAGHYHL